MIHDYDIDYWTRQAMLKYGGSFVQTLAELWEHADPFNSALIKKTWSSYIKEYRAIGEKLRAENVDKEFV